MTQRIRFGLQALCVAGIAAVLAVWGLVAEDQSTLRDVAAVFGGIAAVVAIIGLVQVMRGLSDYDDVG